MYVKQDIHTIGLHSHQQPMKCFPTWLLAICLVQVITTSAGITNLKCFYNMSSAVGEPSLYYLYKSAINDVASKHSIPSRLHTTIEQFKDNPEIVSLHFELHLWSQLASSIDPEPTRAPMYICSAGAYSIRVVFSLFRDTSVVFPINLLLSGGSIQLVYH